ncbi:hypothetical protein Tco_1338651 [Tanacetum coccineum]
MVSQKMKSLAKTFDRSRSSLGLHGNDVRTTQIKLRSHQKELLNHNRVRTLNSRPHPMNIKIKLVPKVVP